MRSHAAYQPITVEQFFDIDFGTDRKYELIDGVIQMMIGGTPAHSHVSVNILAFLHRHLRGTGWRAYTGDMGLRVDDVYCRYPDVSLYCGNPASREREKAERIYSDPVVLFEVSPPSTANVDRVEKLEQYRSITSVDTIVFVDPEGELSRVVQRLGPTSWRDDLFAQPHDIDLPALALSIPHDEIFARD